MTEYEDIEVVLADYVATVEMQRPPHNFFDHSLIGQIANAFDELDENPDCRVIVLASQGKSFCAGANFGGGSKDSSASRDFTEEGFRNTTGILYREAARLFGNKKPIVGAIQGAAIGGGLGLSLVPDFRVAAHEARFGANFVKLGIHQGFGLSYTLPRLVGQQQATLMLYSGRRLNAEQALAIGLVDMVTDQDNLRDEAQGLAKEIAENAPLAVMSVRATMRQGMAAAVAEATELELAEQQWLRGTADAEEGIRAVAQRRPGNFNGN
ncbi:MAG: enoyl-CoA hydratase/isomerase family protein [Pseudomonadales bacterium]|jgi:enoyl-CoA hydratase/carnithine racemase|nr:enoyl-CoA hydratase/isomerase family protein [Pseudomonadales bacterium]MDP6470075.1 enoyl-CoA hydratase/isomerase family protein [Pseudomonadales bacterium]MDP6826978.1 enoyl-CoA hydratase/isomerase family protein [Pseudomonadales bacterium]MDP6971073.1 enoyl-CoA hydratase/isomerase family protein [Pseudomonadales bacterium]|tara:strand:- start:481 stop:1281 length:801 start_codon:yes stop_codon:yes gene_type:complete